MQWNSLKPRWNLISASLQYSMSHFFTEHKEFAEYLWCPFGGVVRLYIDTCLGGHFHKKSMSSVKGHKKAWVTSLHWPGEMWSWWTVSTLDRFHCKYYCCADFQSENTKAMLFFQLLFFKTNKLTGTVECGFNIASLNTITSQFISP